MNTAPAFDLVGLLAAEGYRNIRLLPTGEYAATRRMMYTHGLFLGMTAIGYRTRFCYDTETDAATALRDWDGNGFPPGYWIKQKPEEINGPGAGDVIQ